jgi:hypothetical protein
MTQSPTAVEEDCAESGQPTPHGVAIEIRTESKKRENAEVSREPAARAAGTARDETEVNYPTLLAHR